MGTVDSTRDFDRFFRPTSSRVRERWERLALAQRQGTPMPPIDVYRIGDLHFVKDGHHRVSIAIATGQKTIDAYVTEILTAVPARGIRHRGDLLFKSYERIFRSRVPLSPQAYAKISVTDPWSYAQLGEAVEAWGFRMMQHEHKFSDRCRGRPPVVRRRVHAGGADAARGRPGRFLDRRRGLPDNRPGAIPADAHPRVERRGHRGAAAQAPVSAASAGTPTA